ncbi:hypothetical protein C8R46DRAFT_1216433 [Mycena filopes]|nr:hypothetical protein C8R46DRAFT_1216433 [Mycena filopes]
MSAASSSTSSDPEWPKISPQQYSTTALYSYIADPADPLEISFGKGEVLDILDCEGKWWWCLKADGTVGIAPSNHLRNGRLRFRAKALRNYTANVKDRNEISLIKGDVLEVLDQQGMCMWWQIRKADGLLGYVPSNCLTSDPNIPAEDLEAMKTAKRTSFSADIQRIFETSLFWQAKRIDPEQDLGGLEDPLAEAPYKWKYGAEARSSYTADPADPNELSFREGERLQLAHKRGRWWIAKNSDGATGLVPSTYLEIITWPAYEEPPIQAWRPA